MEGKIYSVYFSPTHSAQKLTLTVSGALAKVSGREQAEVNLTTPGNRGSGIEFVKEDTLVFGFPVYAGRIPALLETALAAFKGRDTPVVALAVYGNRDYGDALLEASDLLKENGFSPVAAAAFIGEHSFSRRLGANRPDETDTAMALLFAGQVAEKLAAGNFAEILVKGQRPYRERMRAMPFSPKTNASCTGCMACAAGCPAGAVDRADPKVIRAGCIQCCACVKGCPAGAKYFDDKQLVDVVGWLEGNFMPRREPEIFI